MSSSEVVSPVTDGCLFREDTAGVHLLASRCRACNATVFPQVVVCPECTGRSIETVDLSVEGTVFAVTIVRVRPPDYLGPVPYGLGLVELPERLRVFSVLLAADVDSLLIGTRVRCTSFPVTDATDGERSYAFVPTEEVPHG